MYRSDVMSGNFPVRRRLAWLTSALLAGSLAAPALAASNTPTTASAASAASSDESPRAATNDHPYDHWHVAYGVFVCDRYLPPIISENDPVGIHTHGDGIIHVHPFFATAAGKNATLGKFFTTVGMKMTAQVLTLPAGKTWKSGDKCGTKPGHLRILSFASDTATTGTVVPGDPSKIRLKDRQILALVFAPDDVAVPSPPSIETLNDLNDVAPTPLDPATIPAIGPKPKLTYPAVAPSTLTITDLVVGKGEAIVAGKHPWVRLVLGRAAVKKEYGVAGWDSQGPVRLRLFGRSHIQPTGLEQGMVGMRVGGRRMFVTPPALGWGAQGDGGAIGPNETLVWIVDLVGVTT